MKILSLMFLMIGLFAGTLTAQTPSKSADPDAAEKNYAGMLAKLKGGDMSIDYKQLRMAYAETKAYSPYGTDRAENAKLFEAFNADKYKEALSIAETILKTNYVDINAHLVSSLSNRELKKTDKADYHQAIFRGLIDSIISGADGKTTKTAYVVICIPEEYAIVNFLQYERGNQALVSADGHRFDVLTVTDENKKTLQLYFNIDIIFKGYAKMLGK